MPETQLESLYERAVRAASKPDDDSERGQAIERLWREVHGGVDVLDPANFGPFLAGFLNDRYQSTEPADRADRLCGCGNPMCNALNGEIPTAMQPLHGRFSGSTDTITPRDARSFVAGHSGCHVIRDALEAWSRKQGKTKQTLMQIINLGHGRRDPGTVVDTENLPGVGERESA